MEAPWPYRLLGGLSCLPRPVLVFLLRWVWAEPLVRLSPVGRAPAPACDRSRAAAFYAETLANLALLCRQWAEGGPSVSLELLTAVAEARRAGRGVILATPHLGDPILGIAALAREGLPLWVVMPGGSGMRWCEFKGLRFLDLGGAAAGCVAALKRNECVFLYADRDHSPGGRRLDFFGAPASPPHGTARLALETGAAIVPAACVEEGGRYRFLAGEAIRPGGETQEGIERRLFAAFEGFIAPRPWQWLLFWDPWSDRARSEKML